MKAQITKETFSALIRKDADYNFRLVETDIQPHGSKEYYYSDKLDCKVMYYICYATGISETYIIDCNY
jgi:hypothetical protein